VSIGNILSCEGGAKLGDLEYAKKVGDVKSHEMRTASQFSIILSTKPSMKPQQGTMHFMSIEVAAQKFLFRPRVSGQSANVIEIVRRARGVVQNSTAPVPFCHNHLHDLESLWWVTVWVVFYNHFSTTWRSGDEPPLNIKNAEHQLKLARILFPSVMKSTDRQNGFQTSIQETCVGLPSNKMGICVYLDGLRDILIKHYTVIESSLPQSINPNSSTDDIYDDFKIVFSSSENDYTDFVLVFIPEIYAQLRREKRPRSESMNDIGVVAQKTPRRK